MKSDVVEIDNQGNGFDDALALTEKVAAYEGLEGKDALHLRLIAEEMLSLARSVTGELKASFWVECDDGCYKVAMTTQTVMDSRKRQQLIASASKRKNDAADSLLGRLRDAFQRAMLTDPGPVAVGHAVPQEVEPDVQMLYVEDLEWDGYERSVLRKIADDIRVGIRGDRVYLTVSKRFA